MSHVLSQIQISPATPVSTIEHGPSPSAHVELLYILFKKIYANLNDIFKLFKSSPEKRVINFVCLCKLYRIWALVCIKKIVCVVPSLFPRRFWFPMLIWVYQKLQKYQFKKSKKIFYKLHSWSPDWNWKIATLFLQRNVWQPKSDRWKGYLKNVQFLKNIRNDIKRMVTFKLEKIFRSPESFYVAHRWELKNWPTQWQTSIKLFQNITPE